MKKLTIFGLSTAILTVLTVTMMTFQDWLGKLYQVQGSPEHMHLKAYIIIWFASTSTSLIIMMLVSAAKER